MYNGFRRFDLIVREMGLNKDNSGERDETNGIQNGFCIRVRAGAGECISAIIRAL